MKKVISLITLALLQIRIYKDRPVMWSDAEGWVTFCPTPQWGSNEGVNLFTEHLDMWNIMSIFASDNEPRNRRWLRVGCSFRQFIAEHWIERSALPLATNGTQEQSPNRNPRISQSSASPLYKEILQILPELRKNERNTKQIHPKGEFQGKGDESRILKENLVVSMKVCIFAGWKLYI